jgi:hypothetical protein
MPRERWQPAPIKDMADACAGWPGTDFGQALMRLALLKIRIERFVVSLPDSVVRVGSQEGFVARKLLLWLGEPGLWAAEHDTRLVVVRRAIAAYRLLSDVTHGRAGDPFLSRPELLRLEDAVLALEQSMEGPTGASQDFKSPETD